MTFDKAKPMTPEEVTSAKREQMPDDVLLSVIAAAWNGHSAVIRQADITRLIQERLDVDSEEVYSRGYLDVEDVYREAGWKVKYDKPGYNESYPATFEFRRH